MKTKRTLMIVTEVLYAVNFLIALLLCFVSFNKWYVVASIAWGIATIAQTISIILEKKRLYQKLK